MTTEIGRRWAGHIFGTNTGNLFVELEPKGDSFTGTLRLMDHHLGLSVYSVQGTFDGTNFNMTGTPSTPAPEGVEIGHIAAQGQVSSQGTIRGRWESDLGTAGTFILHPHDASQQNATANVPTADQLHTETRSFGTIGLSGDQVRELIALVGRDFSGDAPVVTYRRRGTGEVSRYAPHFLDEMEKIGSVRSLKIWTQDKEPNGLVRTISVELNDIGQNLVKVQGSQDAWVLGKTESLATFLREHEKYLLTSVRKFGLNFNGLLLLWAAAVLPDLQFLSRLTYLMFVAAVILTISYLHRKFIPNATIYLTSGRLSLAQRAWPQFASFAIAAASGLAASVMYGLLKGELTLPPW